jgi:anti-anti-sigma factor
METNFSINYENKVVKVTLSGSLDAKRAPELADEIKKLVGKDIEKIVFFAKDLEYISSAGLRVIIFSKQKIGTDIKLYMVGATDDVLDVIRMSGIDNIMEITDTYEE